ncbi:ATP-binding cassette, regulator of translational elongation [Entomophthora muscae]|uniref:ATP-binding cassette, regulator of translational elongation n=1 Tax=Entomophthora muscae TaxID=34485 RepID=A0ACC2SWQ2_9FUNG|nr:ATP-binding cassette, regulator of translational elongation [Entomophthora muscae]
MIYHIYFKIVGDDTPALQSVLRADLFREFLLKEEIDLTATINSIDEELGNEELDEATKEDLEGRRFEADTKLKEVYGKLSDIESDKAESK